MLVCPIKLVLGGIVRSMFIASFELWSGRFGIGDSDMQYGCTALIRWPVRCYSEMTPYLKSVPVTKLRTSTCAEVGNLRLREPTAQIITELGRKAPRDA